MARSKLTDAGVQGGVVIRFNLFGLLAFSAVLVVAGALVASGLVSIRGKNNPSSEKSRVLGALPDISPPNTPPPHEMPPWGELITRDIEVERPEEYIASEVNSNVVPTWTFEGLQPEQVRAMMVSCGLTEAQAALALAAPAVSVTATSTIVRPDEELVLSMSPSTRASLYHELAAFPANHYMHYPFCLQGQNLDSWLENGKVDEAAVATLKRLLYPRGEALCFSDFELVLRSLPSEAQRLALVKALSRQRALLVRLCIRPDSDVDKVLGYWSRGIQVKDARPLLESLKRLPEGGCVSLMFMLPRFARERLYTFPLPPKPNDPTMDCHWSTMNFFNECPDDHFGEPDYTVKYLLAHYYRVAKPTQYGDIVLVLNGSGNAIHSAVYLADDIVFSKNGNNYEQAWMLMRIKDLLAQYSSGTPANLAIYRNKSS